MDALEKLGYEKRIGYQQTHYTKGKCQISFWENDLWKTENGRFGVLSKAEIVACAEIIKESEVK